MRFVLKDEKNQIVHTNVWITLKWPDFHLRWNPNDYGRISTIRVSPDKVWLPDVVLFNNADGQYEVSYYSNVVINYTGVILWVPPAIYKSSCAIDVQYFPFDEQLCGLIFGSWTYGEDDIIFKLSERGINLDDYMGSQIWDLVESPAMLRMRKSRIEFQIRIRRKPLFYTVVLIVPTILMAFLSVFVFYLPADAGEKITLTISVLLSLVVFLLLVSKILPPTSITVPLMAKYLLLTFGLNIITIMVTVVIINVYFRGPATHLMPDWVTRMFLEFLPRILLMKRPMPHPGPRVRYVKLSDEFSGDDVDFASMIEFNESRRRSSDSSQRKLSFQRIQQIGGDNTSESTALTMLGGGSTNITDAAMEKRIWRRNYYKTINAVEYVTDHIRSEEESQKIKSDWKYAAMVIDRILLYIFFGVTLGGTMGILMSAPNVFDPITDQISLVARLRKLYKGQLDEEYLK